MLNRHCNFDNSSKTLAWIIFWSLESKMGWVMDKLEKQQT